ILGTQTGNTLTLTSTEDDSYTASIDISGLYSTQLGYDLSGSRTISTPGSAAGDIDLTNGVTWTDGTLIINGNVTDAGVISSTNGVFELASGSWSQTGTLANFDVFDFRLSGGTFLRATSGDGSEAAPYILTDVYGLQGIDTLIHSHFALGNDIDASGTVNWWSGAGFDPISEDGMAFTGNFDGQNHVISGLIINRPTEEYVGLFAINDGDISNVGLVGGSVTGDAYVGGLAASNPGSIVNAYVTSDATGASSSSIVGGVTAINSGTISETYSTGDISGGAYSAGLVGFNYGTIENAFATGDVTGAVNSGGLVALNNGGITHAYATGDVTADQYAGGLTAFNNVAIVNAYAAGAVSGGLGSGGLVAYLDPGGTVTNSFYDTETTGQNDTGKGTGLTTAEMTDPFTFIDAGWDFETVWSKSSAGENSDYMMLRGFSSDTLYDDFVRLSGDTSKTYGDANPSLDGITLDGVGTDNVTLSWGSSFSETTGAGYYAYAGDAGVLDVAGADDRLVYVDYGSDGLTIGKAALTATANDDSKTYDGLAYSGGNGLTYDGFVNGEDSSVLGGSLAYGGSSQGAKDTGDYVIEASGLTADNYDITYVDGILDVEKASLTITASDDSKTYDGLTYSGGNGITYDGFVSGEDESVLGGSLAYGGTAQGAKDAGTYAIEASGLTSGNYDISYVDGSLDVGKADLIVTASDDSKTYDGLAYSGGNGVTYDGFVSGEDESVLGGALAYGGTAQGAKDAGTYAIEASGLTSGNYDISYVDGSLDIGKASLTITAVDDGKTYDGVAYSGGNGVTYDGFVSGEDESVLGGSLAYGGTSQGAKDAGDYVIEASGLTSGNYDISYVEGSLDIGKADLIVTARDDSKTYDGLTYAGGNGVSYDGFVTGDDESVLGGSLAYGGTSQGAKDAGDYAIEASGLTSGNYNISYVDGLLNIAKASLTITASDDSKTYDGLSYSGGNGVSYDGFVSGEDESVLGGSLAYGGTAQGARDAGDYAISASGLTSGNYEISYVDGSLDVGKADLIVTASDDSKTYDGLSYSGGNGVTYDGFVSGEDESVLSGALAYGGSAQGAKDAGDYVIEASGLTSGNYDISYVDGSLDVEKASLTITAADDSKTYDGLSYAGGNGVSYDGFVDGEDSSVLGGRLTYDGDAQGARNAGTYVITASGLTSGNYDITYLDGALDVARRAITILADAQTKIYGEVDPDLTYTIGGSGLAEGDTEAGVLSGALARTAGETVNGGPYAIGQGSLGANANYTLTYVGNDLTITPAALTVTADDQSKIVDGAVFEGPYTVTLTGLTGGDDASVLGAIDFGGDAISATHAGSYQIIPGGVANPNYTITFVNGTLTLINPVSIPDLPQETPDDGELVDLGTEEPDGGMPGNVINPLDKTDTNPCSGGQGGQDCSNMPHPLNQIVDDRIRFTP
ncbi:MAG: MBG domain-containing protein, partial [Pseudomonadota bacterium]|nr:MBG domain-containing protein [Pseudomonadota bacterium]